MNSDEMAGHPGNLLLRLCQQAQREIVLIAPFVKAATMAKLLAVIAPTVVIRCVTRWRPDEIAVGVSDLEVWPLLSQRSNSSLWLRPDLHAKFYRGDDCCLVGSANLTYAALGWSSQPNLELLISTSTEQASNLRVFEANVFNRVIAVDDDLFKLMSNAVQVIKAEAQINPVVELGSTASSSIDEPPLKLWLPTLRHPEKLYVVYSGNRETLSQTAQETAFADLTALQVPPGLSKGAFESWIGMALLQIPIIRQIDQILIFPQRFGAMRKYLQQHPDFVGTHSTAINAWQNLMRWFLHFMPDRYNYFTTNHSEIFVRRPDISN